MRRLSVLLGATVIAAAIAAPSAAMAHASLASSDPEEGAKVQVMPGQVSLTLTEPVQKASFVGVTSEDGARVTSETIDVLDDTVTTTIDKPAPAGKYKMTYQIVSADEHTVTGTINFEVLTSPAPTPTATPTLAPTSAPGSAPSAAAQPQVAPASGGSTTAKDALTIVGFSVVAMAGLILLLRAGLRSASGEDDD